MVRDARARLLGDALSLSLSLHPSASSLRILFSGGGFNSVLVHMTVQHRVRAYLDGGSTPSDDVMLM